MSRKSKNKKYSMFFVEFNDHLLSKFFPFNLKSNFSIISIKQLDRQLVFRNTPQKSYLQISYMGIKKNISVGFAEEMVKPIALKINYLDKQTVIRL